MLLGGVHGRPEERAQLWEGRGVQVGGGGVRGAGHEAAATAHRLPWLSTGSVPSLLTGGREREEREWRSGAARRGRGGWCCWCPAVAEAWGDGASGKDPGSELWAGGCGPAGPGGSVAVAGGCDGPRLPLGPFRAMGSCCAAKPRLRYCNSVAAYILSHSCANAQ